MHGLKFFSLLHGFCIFAVHQTIRKSMYRNKSIITLLIICLFSNIAVSAQEKNAKESGDFSRQMLKNFNIGWDIYKNTDYRWRNFNIGTAYGKHFDAEKKAYWQVGVQYNWSKYTLFPKGDFSDGTKQIMKTGSISVPLVFGYDIYKNFFSGIKVYTGPMYELILSSQINKGQIPDLKNSQWAWTAGARFRFFAVFSLRVAYSYYPTGLFANGDLNRSAFTFSLGF